MRCFSRWLCGLQLKTYRRVELATAVGLIVWMFFVGLTVGIAVARGGCHG